MIVDSILSHLPLLSLAVFVAGCAGGRSAPATQAGLPSSASSADAPAASTPDTPLAAPSPPDGATVSTPFFSDDSCDQDTDCVPQATCHPNTCVAAEHQGALPAGMLCTDACFLLTLDCNYNRCACVAWGDAGAHKCAMVSSAIRP